MSGRSPATSASPRQPRFDVGDVLDLSAVMPAFGRNGTLALATTWESQTLDLFGLDARQRQRQRGRAAGLALEVERAAEHAYSLADTDDS